MSATFNVAVLYLLRQLPFSLESSGLSVLCDPLIQRKDWVHALFGLGQMVLTAYAAGAVSGSSPGPGGLEHFKSISRVSRARALLHVYLPR